MEVKKLWGFIWNGFVAEIQHCSVESHTYSRPFFCRKRSCRQAEEAQSINHIHYPGLQEAQCIIIVHTTRDRFHSHEVGNAHWRGYPSHHDSITIHHHVRVMGPSGMSEKVAIEGDALLTLSAMWTEGAIHPAVTWQTQEVATCTHLAVSRALHHDTRLHFTNPSWVSQVQSSTSSTSTTYIWAEVRQYIHLRERQQQRNSPF